MRVREVTTDYNDYMADAEARGAHVGAFKTPTLDLGNSSKAAAAAPRVDLLTQVSWH